MRGNQRWTGSGLVSVLLLILAAPLAIAAPGDLDYSFGGFGGGGTIFASGAAYAMALAPDGKVVIADSLSGKLRVRRYLTNGDPDLTFSGDGTALLAIGTLRVTAVAMTVQPDDKIIVVWDPLESTCRHASLSIL